MVLIKENLEILFADNPLVFVARDLLWYPVQGDNKLRQAPNTLVAFGRPKGKRGSYQQWQEKHIVFQVVFEILSPGNTLKEMAKKLVFYDRYAVEEYYLYDPDKNDLSGWLRVEGEREAIDEIHDWVSPRLGIRFCLTDETLAIYRPDGEKFLSPVALSQRTKQSEQRAEQAERRAERLTAKLRQLGVDAENI